MVDRPPLDNHFFLANMGGGGYIQLSVFAHFPGDRMYDTAIAGLKAATPKIIAGGFLGLPLTAVVGPTAGLIAVGALGVRLNKK